jgi:hypothetical protein
MAAVAVVVRVLCDGPEFCFVLRPVTSAIPGSITVHKIDAVGGPFSSTDSTIAT